MELKRDIASKVVELVLDNGLLLNPPRPDLLRFMPALNVSTEEIDTMLEILEDGLSRAIGS
jgi:acetylornithine/N-succinyldiaminopimelate aminotransferase